MYQPKVDLEYNKDSCNRKELYNDDTNGIADQQLGDLAKMKTPKVIN